MTKDLGVWKAEDCALVLIDYQNEMFEVIRSETSAEMVELNVRLLARTAKAFNMPIVLSTVGVKFGLNAPTLPAVLSDLEGIEPIERLPTPDLALFLIGGALIGAGSGAVFKGTTALVLEAAPPEARLAMTSALLIALFIGLSVPVIGAGIALDQGASPPDTVLGFAVLVGLGVCASGWALLSRRPETD
ncbi:isochorismatase family protein [Sphaerisporangium perillae]|uniref:isochorismatase family protein n=1 Tax=Sphaerisporangium perillae TaxID=2935860 RepID=UPI00201058EF|nr:isochorismatase family protein [Sphaerisporangium perillae]